MLADKRFGKALLSLEACVLINNNLLGKLVTIRITNQIS